ncbi:MAG: hypothetical protein K2Q09_11505 [Phycisphaerales bacterium]|nr:hypothetical protein [Phycisphaerales bacterium]
MSDGAVQTSPAMLCNCLLMCNDVHMSIRGQHTLVGIINTMTVDRVPCDVGPFALYVRFHSIRGLQNLQLHFVRAQDESLVIGLEGRVGDGGNDPLGTTTLILMVPQFRLVAEGRYLWQAKANGVPVASAFIDVKAIESGPDAPGH